MAAGLTEAEAIVSANQKDWHMEEGPFPTQCPHMRPIRIAVSD